MFRVLGIKILTSSNASVENLSHQLQQRCSVSGTAKGKAKLKALQAMKKSKSGGKKGGQSSGGGPRKAGLAGELEEMANMCLNTSTPMRFMRTKERAREAEREKLGLISKERQREIALLKKQAKEGTGSEKPGVIGTPGLDFISLGLVDADALPKYELTVEDGRRLAKEYSRVLMKKHRARQKAECTILRLKKEAIEALPEHLKAAAMIPDLTPFPANRYMATLTPPIEGYIEKIREATERATGREKLR